MKVICQLCVFFTLFITLSSYAQIPDAVTLEKTNKDMMKNVKKKSNAAKVWIEVAPDGYWYYRVSSNKNDGPFGAYDQNGEVIAPLNAYYSFLEYLPAMDEGRSKLPRHPSSIAPGEFVLSHHKVKGTFLGRTTGKTNFIALDGTVTNVPDADVFFTIFPGWVMINVHSGNDNMHGESVTPDFLSLSAAGRGDIASMYTSDGQLYIENFSSIYIDKEQNIQYNRHINDVPKQGMKNIENPYLDIPCEYAGVIYSNGKYMVNETKNSPSHEYVNGETATTNFRDDGERLYEIEDWEGVIEYYGQSESHAPWKNYYSGLAMSNLAGSDLVAKKKYIQQVTDGEWDRLNNTFFSNDFKSVDTLTDIELILGAKELLETYLDDEDNPFRIKAEIGIQNCDDYLNNLLPFVKEKYDIAVAAHKNHNIAQAQKIDEEQQKKQQQAMLFVGLINNIVSSIGNTTSNKPTATNTQNISVPSIQSSSKSGTSVDNTSRKGFLKGQIIEWKNKLKKAEASRQQALENYQNNPTHAAKRALDSKENTVNECLNMIRQYESELNGL